MTAEHQIAEEKHRGQGNDDKDMVNSIYARQGKTRLDRNENKRQTYIAERLETND